MRILVLLALPSTVLSGVAAESLLLDLEAQRQNFVLETRKIEIPGHPFAFNPAILRWKGQLLLSFRVLPNPKCTYDSEIGLVFLSEEFEPISEPQLLNLRDENAVYPSRAEDARLLTIGDRLFMVYDDNVEMKISKGGFRMYVAELSYSGDHFIAENIECLRYYDGESPSLREKSWVPFEYLGNLLLAYSLAPHKIFYPRLDGSEACDLAAFSDNLLSWDYGTLRGGTSAHLDGDQYLAFFHSSIEMATLHSQGKNWMHYFMGAYTFSKEHPFAITAISQEPIIGEYFYNGIDYKPYWKPIRCVFPCGFISDENFIYVTYGRDDHECWVVKLDKDGLLQSLKTVKQ